MKGLDNYLALLSRVDALCEQTRRQFPQHISCRPGCDSCCRHLSVCAVEGAALAQALRELPSPERELIRSKARQSAPDSPCPLLHEGLCLLYRARPIICRTHGLPLLVLHDGTTSVDFCPENFRGVSSIPGSAVLDLERLNTALTAVNSLFLQSFPGPERVTMAQLLLAGTD